MHNCNLIILILIYFYIYLIWIELSKEPLININEDVEHIDYKLYNIGESMYKSIHIIDINIFILITIMIYNSLINF